MSLKVVVEHSYSLLMVRLKELFVGMICCSCALPQYFTRAMLIGERRVTQNY